MFQILTCNDMSCEMFGCESSSLVGRKLSEILHRKDNSHRTLEELEVDPNTGEILKISGKIVCTD